MILRFSQPPPPKHLYQACYLKMNSVPVFMYCLRNLFEVILTEEKAKSLEKNMSQLYCILYMFHEAIPVTLHHSSWRKKYVPVAL